METGSSDGSLYDVIVAGSGPAGGTAAYHLAKVGKRVLLIEKEHLPRYKTCGGGLSERFLRAQFPFSFDPILKTRVEAVSYIYRGRVTTVPLRTNAISMVMRAELDQYLLDQAQAQVIQGAAVRAVKELPDRVEVETQGGRSFGARYLIGADGANSVVARALGLRPRRVMAAAIEAEAPVPAEVMRRYGQQLVFIFGEIPNGYVWIFPKPDHLSVGAGALHPKPGELQKTLIRVMDSCGISLDHTPLRGHPIPIYTGRERVSSARTLLAGDAAGLADPLSGEGIRYAIKSGRLAAECLLAGQPERYPQRLFWSIGLNHLLTMAVAMAFYVIPFPFLCLGIPNPFCTQGLVDILADRMTIAELIPLGLATTPALALTELTARACDRLGRRRLARRIRESINPEDVAGPLRRGRLR